MFFPRIHKAESSLSYSTAFKIICNFNFNRSASLPPEASSLKTFLKVEAKTVSPSAIKLYAIHKSSASSATICFAPGPWGMRSLRTIFMFYDFTGFLIDKISL
nr:hypothetical protein Iba_chr05fCG11860 [Ipomoea batatas]